jgi:hypothetical protein
MTEWAIKLPIRDPDEVVDVKAAGELPDHVDSGDDRDITRELLIFAQEAAYPHACTVGDVEKVVDSFDAGERKGLLEVLWYRAGLCSLREAKQARAYELAQHEIRHRIIYDEEPRWASGPAGQIVDLNEIEREQARAFTEEQSRANRAGAREQEQQAAAAEAREHERAQAEQYRRETPLGFPTP